MTGAPGAPSRFLDALRDEAGGRLRVPRAGIWRAFRLAWPVEATAGDARERLMQRLSALADIELPAPRGAGWDRTAEPHLPEWVTLRRQAPQRPDFDPHTVPWAPELAFVPATPGVDLQAALAIQAFFAAGGRSRPSVPSRERSVLLFGDEKRLEGLVRTPLFGPGRLDLAALRCFSMAPPLVFETGTPGRPCLVVENHHTWWSFCAWNRSVGAYAAVVYGAGGAFGRDAVGFLEEHCAAWGTSTVHYFGDLDRQGLLIPSRAAAWCAARGLTLAPATAWYARLLELARHVDLPTGPPLDVDPEALAWLPAEVAAATATFFARGVRIPQELVGSEVLAGEPASPNPAIP